MAVFDPYYKWLGIPTSERQRNHYRLLGLALFETDLDVIEGAADRQMGFVRQYQSGEHASDAAKILNELANARLCLLKPATKAAYDAKLQQELSPPEPEIPEPPFSTGDPGPKKGKKSPASANAVRIPQRLMIGGGVSAVVLAIVAVYLLSGPKAAVNNPATPSNVAATPASEPSASPKRSSSGPTDPPGPKSVLWTAPKLVTAPIGKPVDVLQLVDLKRDVVAGEWKQTSTALIGPRHGKVYLPVKLPEDYQLKFDVRRIEGDDTLTLGFVMSGRQGLMVFDGFRSTLSGLLVDGSYIDSPSNGTARRGKLFQDQSATIVLTVHPGHLHAAFGGQTIVDWFGDPQRLFLHADTINGSRESPLIACADSKFVFESITLVPIQPEPALARVPRLDREVEVLPLVDLDRDAQRGIWAISKNTLSSPDGAGRIYLPTVVPEEYTVSATVELPPQHQGDFVLAMGLVAGTSIFQLVSSGSDIGLDMLNGGQRWNANETRLAGPMLKPGIPVRIDCTVAKSGIRVVADGKTVIDWRGDVRRLSLPGDWAFPDGRRLFLGTSCHMKFRDVKLGPPIPSPKLPDHPPFSVGKPVDLLALIDPTRDATGGTWERDGTSLRCRGDAMDTNLVIPLEPPDEYKLTMRVARINGGKLNTDSLSVGLPIGKSKALVGLDAYGSTVSGIYLDHTELKDHAQSFRGGPVIPAGTEHEIVFVVRNTGLQVTSDGKKVIDWTGNPDRCWALPYRVSPGRRLLIGSYNQGLRFEKIELEPVPATSPSAVAPLGDDGKLLPIMNVDRDSRQGDWKLEDDGLSCRNVPYSRVRIPAPVPPHYVFSVTAERKQGNADLFIGLLVGGNPCAVSIDGDRGHQAGIDLLDGKTFSESGNLTNRRYKDALLPVNKSVQIQCFVLPDTIVVTCGDTEVIRWHGDSRRLSEKPALLPPNYSDADRNQLWLGAWYSEFVFRDLELKPLTDAEADELSSRFSGVFPTISQTNVSLALVGANTDTKTMTGETPGSGSSVSKPSPPAKPGEWIDLLEWAEGINWTPRGINWNDNIEKPTKNGIAMKSIAFNRYPLPAIIDGDYEMEVEFTRHDGNESVGVVFPLGIHNMHLEFGATAGTIGGVGCIDGKWYPENPTKRSPSPVTNNERHSIKVRVHNDGLQASFSIDWDQAADYIKWEGPSTALNSANSGKGKVSLIGHPWLTSYSARVTFDVVRVRMLSGTIRRDVITDADREQDLKNGFVRLVGEQASAVKVGFGKFTVNQFPLEIGDIERRWPMITRDFKPCDEFYGAHAPSRLKCPIPTGAKSFSVVGYNDSSRTAKYLMLIDGTQVQDSGVTDIAIMKIDIPAKSSLLELVTDPAGDKKNDHTYWCFPRFHAVPAERVTDKMLDGRPGLLKFSIASKDVGVATLTHNQPIGGLTSVPIHFRDAVACDEFLVAHAPSTVTYLVPEGMTRFTGIGYNVLSHHVKYEVWADAKRIYESPQAGIIPIDVKLPSGTKTIELKVNHLGDGAADQSLWCYPRLHRK